MSSALIPAGEQWKQKLILAAVDLQRPPFGPAATPRPTPAPSSRPRPPLQPAQLHQNFSPPPANETTLLFSFSKPALGLHGPAKVRTKRSQGLSQGTRVRGQGFQINLFGCAIYFFSQGTCLCAKGHLKIMKIFKM